MTQWREYLNLNLSAKHFLFSLIGCVHIYELLLRPQAWTMRRLKTKIIFDSSSCWFNFPLSRHLGENFLFLDRFWRAFMLSLTQIACFTRDFFQQTGEICLKSSGFRSDDRKVQSVLLSMCWRSADVYSHMN